MSVQCQTTKPSRGQFQSTKLLLSEISRQVFQSSSHVQRTQQQPTNKSCIKTLTKSHVCVASLSSLCGRRCRVWEEEIQRFFDCDKIISHIRVKLFFIASSPPPRISVMSVSFDCFSQSNAVAATILKLHKRGNFRQNHSSTQYMLEKMLMPPTMEPVNSSQYALFLSQLLRLIIPPL